MVDTHGSDFCSDIKDLWHYVNSKPFQYLYMTWPGYVLPYPTDYEFASIDIKMEYCDECIELSPFVLVSNVFHLFNEVKLASKIFGDRNDYHKHLLYHRNKVEKENIIIKDSKNNCKQSRMDQRQQKFERPFQFITDMCTFNKFKCISLNNRFDLCQHHEKMLGDEMVLISLKANGFYLCITKDYIFSTNMKKPIAYSSEALHHFSYGLYIGIKHGLYISKRQVSTDIITKFSPNYDQTVFKVC
jgi:hypothetical protein